MNIPFDELVDLVSGLGRLSVVLQSERGGEADLVLRQAQLLHGLSRLHQPQGLEQHKRKHLMLHLSVFSTWNSV